MKLLILDADGVLWAGVAGQRIQPYYNVQAEYQNLSRSNDIPLALVTRNTREHIIQAFKDERNVMSFGDFWDLLFECSDKGTGIHRIAETLGVPLEDVTYVDDELATCEMVMEALPSVNVVHAPRKHALDVARAVAESVR